MIREQHLLEENDKLPHICSKFIFKILLLDLVTEGIYSFQSQLCKQTDGCTMGSSLPVTFSNIYRSKLEKDKVMPIKDTMKANFCYRYTLLYTTT